MTTITRTIEINATRDTIRKYYAHPVYTPQWANRLYLWEPEEDWPAAGSTAKMGFKSGGLEVEGVATTLSYDLRTMQHHFRLEAKSFAPMDFRYRFDENDGKTAVTYKIDYTIPGSFLGQVLDKLFVERQNTRDTEQMLANLKALAEGDA